MSEIENNLKAKIAGLKEQNLDASTITRWA